MSRKGKAKIAIIMVSVIALAMVALFAACPLYTNLREPAMIELKPPVEPPQGPTVNFPDPALEAAIREALQIPYREIHRSDLERFISFSWPYDPPITNLAGLEHAVNLRVLLLHEHRITNVSPLANLINLESLWLQWNHITDISPLSDLINLEVLVLEGNEIRDVAPLAGLINLYLLDIRANQIEDIGALVQDGALPRLSEIRLADNPLNDNAFRIYIPEFIRRGVHVFWGRGG